MPASIKLQQQYGSDLQVLFVESQGADSNLAEAFAWRQKWMSTQAIWSLEAPLQVQGNTLPKFALLDIEGNLLLSGNPLDQKKQIEEAIADQVKKAKDPPTGTSPKLAKEWSMFVKGDYAAAIAECDKHAASDASLADAIKPLRAEMVARVTGRIERAKWLIDNGFVTNATALLASLEKATKANEELSKKVADQTLRLTEASAVNEVEGAKALAALQDKMAKDKPFEDANVKALGRLADKYKGTKAGERAAHLAELAKVKI